MSQFDEDGNDERIERLASNASVRKEGWKRTNEDMKLIAEERRDEGWDVVAVPAVHTDTVSPDMGEDSDRFGFVHVIADNHADDVADTLASASFDRYEAYRSVEGDQAFLVVELLDDGAETALLIASHYDRNEAEGMIAATRERDVLFTHLKRLDGTHLGTVRHEEYEPLLATPE